MDVSNNSGIGNSRSLSKTLESNQKLIAECLIKKKNKSVNKSFVRFNLPRYSSTP